MDLPLTPPLQPMLATAVDGIPHDADLLFEPKWDGFRCVVFRAGEEVFLQSRSGKPLNRYFPEVVAEMLRVLPERVVVDGELVVARNDELDFDALSERIHPAASRVTMLSETSPATFVAFDLLALGSADLLESPAVERRAALLELPGLSITPATTSAATAQEWFTLFEGAGLDGVMGKPAQGSYTPGKRSMIKVKHARDADVVLAGLRWHKDTEPGTAVGSLLLGVYDDNDVLHHIGVCGSFKAADRRALATELAPLITTADDHPWATPAPGQRIPGEINRWRGKQAEYVALRPERVVEIHYTQVEGEHPVRLRHNGQFARWRPDREPLSCRYDQLDRPARYDVASVLKGELKAR